MDQAQYKADLLEITVSGTFKTVHVFNSPAGLLGDLTIKGNKGEGRFMGAEQVILDINKPSFWKNHYEIQQGITVVGKAHPPKKLRRAFEINLEGEIFNLAPGGSKRRSWSLMDAQGQGICEILPRGGFKRGAFIKIRAETSLKLLVFSYFLVDKRWQEERAAAAAA